MCMLPYCTHAQNYKTQGTRDTLATIHVQKMLQKSFLFYELRVIEKKTTVYY